MQNQNQEDQNSSTPPGNSDPRKSLVNAIFSALATDYTSRFTGQFRRDGEGDEKPTINGWKRAFYKHTIAIPDDILSDAVDNCCRANRDYPPTLRMIRDECESLVRRRNSERRAIEERQRASERTCIDTHNKILELRLAAARRKRMSPDDFKEALRKHNEMVAPYSAAATRLARERGSSARS